MSAFKFFWIGLILSVIFVFDLHYLPLIYLAFGMTVVTGYIIWTWYEPAHSEHSNLQIEKETNITEAIQKLKPITSHTEIRDELDEHSDLKCFADPSSTEQVIGSQQKNEDCEYRTMTFMHDFMQHTGLHKFYPNKLRLTDIIQIHSYTRSVETVDEIALMFVKNLIMINYTSRDDMVKKYIKQIQQKRKKDTGIANTTSELSKTSIFDDCDDNEDDVYNDYAINPLDLTVAVFKCSSPMLQQILANKLFTCQLAVPLVFPGFGKEEVTLSVWPLRSIIIEIKTEKGAYQSTSVDCPCDVVSFIRLSRPLASKSKLLNEILTDTYHNTFFNKDCPIGTTKRRISEGLVEAGWYIPSIKSNSLSNLTMFLNLRGDGKIHIEQLKLLKQISSILVILINITDLENDETKTYLNDLYTSNAGVILALETNKLDKKAYVQKLTLHISNIPEENSRKIKAFRLTIDGQMRSMSIIKSEMKTAISDLLHHAHGTKPLLERITDCNIKIDEKNGIFIPTEKAAADILNLIPKENGNVKENIVPLQGETWRSWSRKLKTVYKSSSYKTLEEKDKIKQEMKNERKKQIEKLEHLGSIMTLFLHGLNRWLQSETNCMVFVLWLRLYLDERSRKVLPAFLLKYQMDWKKLKTARDNKGDETVIKQLREEVEKSEYNLAEASFGIEHLCREMGQIYEALRECGTETEYLQRQVVELPKITARLLLMGQPFEIVDGDAANVPFSWVKAVLTELNNLLGDKKLLALSALGIQSSGKSTLLNAMFGLQFPVSAGRCTRGVFVQLVPMNEENLPFDFALVIDTEGLRAPELAHQKYSHDNELATLVIGLSDITIINIKGENTAEMKDVLQIAVHAFLRLKLANERLNLKQHCVFVHQNVPALDANDKMMQGRQKFVEILDEMTKEAADQENIADIQSFNQVIDFDSEKNVWYFSDLWRGDPPMAPANPGYSESVMNVKKAILYELTTKRKTYYTITQTICRIEDLWNGILQDDFVFSFRNSLEVKAYNSMDQKFQTISWKLEKYVLEFIKSEAKSKLVKCQSQEELDKGFPEIVAVLGSNINTTIITLIKELNSFVEESTLKDVMIQWSPSKSSTLQQIGTNLLWKAKTEIHQTKEEIGIKRLQLKAKTENERNINELARDLAHKMQGKIPSRGFLEEKFNTLWQSWISQFTSKNDQNLAPMKEEINLLLYQKFPHDANFIANQKKVLHEQHFYETCTQLEGTLKSDMISNKEHLSIRKNLHGYGWNEVKPRTCKLQTIDVADKIFKQIDLKLIELSAQDTRFDLSYVTEILNIINNEIISHNSHTSNEYKFNILPPFRALIFNHVVKYITVKFTKINNEYDKKHSIKAQMEEYRGTVWSMFKNMVDCKTEDVIAIGFFREAIKKVIEDHVSEFLPIDAQGFIRQKFENGKYSLIKKILTDLANNENFNDYKSYIQDPYSFAEKWILNFTNKTMFGKNGGDISMYARIAKLRISRIVQNLLKSVDKATETCNMQTNPCMTNWIETFIRHNNDSTDLPLSNDVLIHMRNSKVTDFANFRSVLIEELSSMEKTILSIFKATTSTSILWKNNPVPEVMNKLWGCSEKCMFCKETCMNTTKDHIKDGVFHQCLQHRPQAIGGFRKTKTGKMTLEFCNYLVSSKQTYSKDKFEGLYKEYKHHFPDWDIPHNSETSKYWMWVLTKYQREFAQLYDCKLADLQENWSSLTKQMALESL